MDIQWYPGHMAKARKRIVESLSLVDVVIELVDARIPAASKNPDIDKLAAGKRRIIALNKADLADAAATAAWLRHYESKGITAIAADMSANKGLDKIFEAAFTLMSDKIEREKKRGRIFVPVKAMVIGIPNVGKSTMINRFVGKAPTKTADKPGVTRGNQWIKLRRDFYLLDTPGILWPKFDEATGVNLAITGAIKENLLDSVKLACSLIEKLGAVAPEAISARYGVSAENSAKPADTLEAVGKARGHILKGGEVDINRTAAILLDEFRGGKLGRITLELLPNTFAE